MRSPSRIDRSDRLAAIAEGAAQSWLSDAENVTPDSLNALLGGMVMWATADLTVPSITTLLNSGQISLIEDYELRSWLGGIPNRGAGLRRRGGRQHFLLGLCLRALPRGQRCVAGQLGPVGDGVPGARAPGPRYIARTGLGLRGSGGLEGGQGSRCHRFREPAPSGNRAGEADPSARGLREECLNAAVRVWPAAQASRPLSRPVGDRLRLSEPPQPGYRAAPPES